MLDGPATAPAGAITVPAGNNGSLDPAPNTTYWFAPGVHTLGTGAYNQIIPANNDWFVGAPGAVLDGQNKNNSAFTQHATGVTISYLTIRNFISPLDQGVVNHDSGNGWTIANNSIVDNAGRGAHGRCQQRDPGQLPRRQRPVRDQRVPGRRRDHEPRRRPQRDRRQQHGQHGEDRTRVAVAAAA